jgi:hypothetical protein
MPCKAYGSLDDEDIYSVIAYLRTMAPIENVVPASRSDFPVNFIIRTMPTEGQPTVRPPMKDSLAYGKYITTAAACFDCHTPVTEKGAPVLSKGFSGGREFPMPDGGICTSTNITFDNETGIGDWDMDKFIHAFKSYDLASYVPKAMEEGDENTVMPWTMYANMDTADLAAIYYYLKSLPPVPSAPAAKKE